MPQQYLNLQIGRLLARTLCTERDLYRQNWEFIVFVLHGLVSLEGKMQRQLFRDLIVCSFSCRLQAITLARHWNFLGEKQ